MPEGKAQVLILMAGPKFDLDWEFGERLRGLSEFSTGYLLTSSSAERDLTLGEYTVLATHYEPSRFAGSLRSKLDFMRQCFRTVRAAIREGRRFDIVVAYDPLLTGAIALVLSKLCGARLVIEVNGEYTDPANFMHVRSRMLRSIKRWLAGCVVRFVLRRAAGIRILFEGQLENLGYLPSQDQVVMQFPEFVNTLVFRNLGEEPCVLLVGFPFYVKGVDIAIRAFKRVASEFPDWRLAIMGHYPDSGPIEFEIGDSMAIERLAPVLHREMTEYVGRCGIIIQPSRTESMGRVLVEAMAAGKPRIATRVGGIPTVVRDGEDGLLVEPDDVEGLAAALAKLMGNSGLRRELGEAGATRVDAEFAPATYFRNVRQLFERVARSGTGERQGSST